MSYRSFVYNSKAAPFVFGTETKVFGRVLYDVNSDMYEYKLDNIERAVPAYLESSSLNWMATLDSAEMGGIHRIQGYELTEDGSIKPCQLSTGVWLSIMLDDIAYFRKQGILLVGKAKSQTDVFYKWVNPHMKTISLWQIFLEQGKLFKEFQRCLGGTIVVPTGVTTVNVAVVDCDAHIKSLGMDIKDFGDGRIITKHHMTLAYGGVVEEMYSFGVRVLDHPVFTSVKGNLVSDESEFNKLCKFGNINPLDVDVIIPLSSVKVGNPELGKIYDITDYIRYISYRTERVQNMGRITTVGAMTLGRYATVICNLLGDYSAVDRITFLSSDVISGDLAAYAKAVRAGMNSSVMAEVSAIALPIWDGIEGRWTIIRVKEIVDQLYSRVVSIHQKQVRKVRLIGAMNLRAYCTSSIELANKDNYTGAFIVRRRKGVIEIPQDVWVGRTLGDYDGDDAVLVVIAKGVYIIFRNPVNGPSSIFIGLEKGKASVQDVPEWAMSLVRYHKQVKAIPEPAKSKVELPTTFKGFIDQYIESLANAAANGPLLGQATNNLYLGRLMEIVDCVMIKSMQYAWDAAKIEFEVVKAIKSTLGSTIKLDLLNKFVVFGGPVTVEHCDRIQSCGVMIDQFNSIKLDSIFPRPKLEPMHEQVWEICSKFNYQCSYDQYMRNIVKFTNIVLSKDPSLVDRLPIVRVTSGYRPESWIAQNDADVLVAYSICREIAMQKRYYKLPLCDLNQVRKVNMMYMIFTAKRNPSDETINVVQTYLSKQLDNIRANNIRGEELVKAKIAVAKILFRKFMNVHEKYDFDDIIVGFQRGANILMGVRDLYDTQLRSFAYTCIHAYVRAYIVTKFSDEKARCSAMMETGRIVFGINNGRAKSSRLFWQYFSTFSKESMAYVSNMWCDAQTRIAGSEVCEIPMADDAMADLFEHAHNVMSDDIDNVNPVDLDDIMMDDMLFYDECELFDSIDLSPIDCEPMAHAMGHDFDENPDDFM
jgi:hypothetical protein